MFRCVLVGWYERLRTWVMLGWMVTIAWVMLTYHHAFKVSGNGVYAKCGQRVHHFWYALIKE